MFKADGEFSIPANYAWILFSFLISWFVLQYLGFQVGRARRRYNIKYPKMYGDPSDGEDYVFFNCYQRAHQNTLEGYTQFVVAMLLAGLRFPIGAAVCGILWSIGRIGYAHGYYTSPDKRNNIVSVIAIIANLILWIGVFSTALHFLGVFE